MKRTIRFLIVAFLALAASIFYFFESRQDKIVSPANSIADQPTTVITPVQFMAEPEKQPDITIQASPTAVNTPEVPATATPNLAAAGTSCSSHWTPITQTSQSSLPADPVFTQEVEMLLQTVPGRWGAYIKNITSGETVSVAGEEDFLPASTIKVAVALEVFNYLEQNPLMNLTSGVKDSPKTIEQLLRDMLIISSEDATLDLENFLSVQAGADVNKELGKWGIEHTTILPRKTTPADLAQLLEQIYLNKALNPENTRRLLDILHVASEDDLKRIGKGLPSRPDVCLAHKIGQGFGPEGNVIGDIGLVETPGYAYIIVVIGNEVPHPQFVAAEQMIATISRLSYENFVENK